MKARVRKFKYKVATHLNGRDKAWSLLENDFTDDNLRKLMQSFMASNNLNDICSNIAIIDDATGQALQFVDCMPVDFANIAIYMYHLSDDKFFSFIGYRSDMNSVGLCMKFKPDVFDISKQYVWNRHEKRVMSVDEIEGGNNEI